MTRLRQRIAERLVAGAAHRRDPHHVQRGRHERGDGAARALQGALQQKRTASASASCRSSPAPASRRCEEIPVVNAEIDGDDIVYHKHVHLGVAVGTERGLVVPVVHDADRMSFAEHRARDRPPRRAGARQQAHASTTCSGGTFTISNGGVYGSLLSTPILNPPQSGILGMHKIEKRPVVVDDQIVIRPMMYVALSYDHRLVDGEQAVTFLVRVKERLEDPSRLLLDSERCAPSRLARNGDAWPNPSTIWSSSAPARAATSPPSAPRSSACASRASRRTPTLGGTCLNVGCIPSKALLDSSEHYPRRRATASPRTASASATSRSTCRR